MNKTKSNDIQTSMDTNSSNCSIGKKRKFETTYMKQSNSKLLCTTKQQFDFIEISRNKSLNFKEHLETSKEVSRRG